MATPVTITTKLTKGDKMEPSGKKSREMYSYTKILFQINISLAAHYLHLILSVWYVFNFNPYRYSENTGWSLKVGLT
jgi:hypothetical protein